MGIYNLTRKLNKLSISVEKFEEKTSSHQKLHLHHVEKSDDTRINHKYDIQSEIRLIIDKMDKINVANLNMPNLSTPFSHIRIPVKPKEEMKNPFITDLSHQDNNQVLMKESPQLKELPTLTSEGGYDHMSFMKTIEMLKEDYAIPGELLTAILHSLFEKSAKRCYYGIRKKKAKKYFVSVENEIMTKWENVSWRYKQ
ncbi:hypothetical protein O181_044706 [Austropuccinia psidii MF-1]|uniref:Uncharacterized protein n=1 Tax=Austropuccinia psidii MF-1 TaxID=1389203 RepID=A0A9Q3DIV7_9BASI|nr:hypothetical protein [Austropuccinia psidii MF-1]